MLTLFRYNLDCGRMGYVESLFVADDQDVANAIGKNAYFGEILGKHSEIEAELEESDFTVLSRDQDKIRWLLEVNGGFETISGYNPLEYIEDSEYEGD